MEGSHLTSSSSRLPPPVARITHRLGFPRAPSAFLSPTTVSFFRRFGRPDRRFPPIRPLYPLFSFSGTMAEMAQFQLKVSWEEGRIGEVKRVTKETNVHMKLNLDGSGIADCSTGIPFLDHMLDQLASHGILDMYVRASGDIHIDDHHTNEVIALAIGTALLQALGDREGIYRFGHFAAPLDEAGVEVILDLSSRPHLSCDFQIPTESWVI